MLLGSIAFAWMAVLAHELGAVLDWQVVAIARSLIPLVIVGGLALAAGVRFVFFRPAILWMRSLAGSLSLVGTFYVLPKLPASDVLTITNIFPIWVALLSWPLLGEKPTLQVWISVISGVLGVALIQRPHLEAENYIVFIPLGVSLFTALAMIGLHRLKGIDTRAVVVHFSTVALCFSLAAYFLAGTSKNVLIPQGLPLWELVGVGISATIGQLFLTLAFTHGEPAKVSVVGLTQIVFALMLDTLVLGHPLAPEKLLGVPLVIGPTAWIMLRRPLRKEELPPEPLETPAAEDA